MSCVPVFWFFDRNKMMPILEAFGEAGNKMGELVLIESAVKIIEKAKDFGGIVRDIDHNKRRSAPISVRFSIIFSNEQKRDEYLNLVQTGQIFY
ncbi:MAG: hypothetical protein E7311_04595 [Clostridiales bacterium]|nr:hypothetical protein [Clostridiales bacterium]